MFAANVNVNVGGDSSDEKYQGMNSDILSAFLTELMTLFEWHFLVLETENRRQTIRKNENQDSDCEDEFGLDEVSFNDILSETHMKIIIFAKVDIIFLIFLLTIRW